MDDCRTKHTLLDPTQATVNSDLALNGGATMHSKARLNCPDGDRMDCSFLLRRALCFATALLLAGCATEEKLAVKGECQSEAYRMYPVKMETYVITKTRSVEVPDGTISCTTVGSGDYKRTDCREGKKYVDEKYEVEEARDSNSLSRYTYIDRCTSQRCAQRYGNSGCKIEQQKAAATNPSGDEDTGFWSGFPDPPPEMAMQNGTVIWLNEGSFRKPRGAAKVNGDRACAKMNQPGVRFVATGYHPRAIGLDGKRIPPHAGGFLCTPATDGEN